MKAILQIGKKQYLTSQFIARGLQTLLRGGPRFSFWVAVLVFLASSGALLASYLKLSELKSETSGSSVSTPTTASTPASTNSNAGGDK